MVHWLRCHITHDKWQIIFSKLHETEDTVFLADDSSIAVKDVGSGELIYIMPTTVKSVMYIPSLPGGVLDPTWMQGDLRWWSIYKYPGKGDIWFSKSRQKNIKVAVKKLSCETNNNLTKQNCNTTVWHQQVGYRDPNTIRKLYTDGLANEIDRISNVKTQVCETCAKGKITQLQFLQDEIKTSAHLFWIHSDVYGPMQTLSPSGCCYMLTLIDNYSRFIYVHLLTQKSQAPRAVRD